MPVTYSRGFISRIVGIWFSKVLLGVRFLFSYKYSVVIDPDKWYITLQVNTADIYLDIVLTNMKNRFWEAGFQKNDKWWKTHTKLIPGDAVGLVGLSVAFPSECVTDILRLTGELGDIGIEKITPIEDTILFERSDGT